MADLPFDMRVPPGQLMQAIPDAARPQLNLVRQGQPLVSMLAELLWE